MNPRHRSCHCGGVLLSLAAAVPAPADLVGLLPLNVNLDHIAHSETLTWSLLGVLGVTLGMVTACGLGIYQQFRRATPSTPEAELLEEIKRQARRPGPCLDPSPMPPATEAPWERPADWWKNPPQD